jgi:hypothetical protein
VTNYRSPDLCTFTYIHHMLYNFSNKTLILYIYLYLYLLIKEGRFLPIFFVRFGTTPSFQSNLRSNATAYVKYRFASLSHKTIPLVITPSPGCPGSSSPNVKTIRSVHGTNELAGADRPVAWLVGPGPAAPTRALQRPAQVNIPCADRSVRPSVV